MSKTYVMDEILKAIILGIIQGITEFLPISSTAHLLIIPWIFGWKGTLESLSFSIAVHVGTLFSLLYCFWRDWIEVIFSKRKMILYLIVGTIPAGLTGVLFHDIIENQLRNPLIVVFTLIFFGVVMIIAEKIGRKHRKEVTILDSIIVGTAQAIALIPGVSRSGITISAGLFIGLERAYAAKFSFLLSTPAIAGAAFLDVYKSIQIGYSYEYSLFIIGVISSAVTGILAIKFLLNFLKRYSLNFFVYYRWFLAMMILLLYFLKR